MLHDVSPRVGQHELTDVVSFVLGKDELVIDPSDAVDQIFMVRIRAQSMLEYSSKSIGFGAAARHSDGIGQLDEPVVGEDHNRALAVSRLDAAHIVFLIASSAILLLVLDIRPSVGPKGSGEPPCLELLTVFDVHGQCDLENVVTELQDELHIEAIVGALRPAPQQEAGHAVVRQWAWCELVEDAQRLVGVALERVGRLKNPVFQVGAPLLLLWRHDGNRHLH